MGNVNEQMNANSQEIKIKLNGRQKNRTQLVQARPEIWLGGVEGMEIIEKTGCVSLQGKAKTCERTQRLKQEE